MRRLPYAFQSVSLTCTFNAGAKALGPEKTISGKLQETLTSATQQARAVDEQRGISKTATDVRIRLYRFRLRFV